jgi:cysteine dioxygenase
LHRDPIKIHPEIAPATAGMILDHLAGFASLPAQRAEVSAAFKKLEISESEIRRCGEFVPGERSRFEIAKAEAFVLLAIFWDNMQSPIHDHEQSDCGFRVIAGEVEETRFRIVEGDLVRPIATRVMLPGESAKSTAGAIHRLGVPRNKSGQSITLHAYCPILGFDSMAIYLEVDAAAADRLDRARDRASDRA